MLDNKHKRLLISQNLTFQMFQEHMLNEVLACKDKKKLPLVRWQTVADAFSKFCSIKRLANCLIKQPSLLVRKAIN